MSLVQELIRELIENKPVALFGGGFKPPTRGHLEVVLQGLKENPEVKHVQILVGGGSRNNISQQESVDIWKMYQKFLPVPSEIIPVSSPFKYFKDYLTSHQDEKVYVFIGARPDNEEDDKDVAERSAYVKKYSENVIPVKVQTKGGVSGTMARKAAMAGNTEEFLSYFPQQLSKGEKQAILNKITSVVKEQVNFKSLEKQLDDMFAELDIDVAFTNHFKERVIERGLTEEDILELANKIIDRYSDELDFLDQGQNIVMSHLSRLVDIAAINAGYGDDYLKDLVFKTAFKRKDKSEPEFRTNKSSPRLAVNEHSMGDSIDLLPYLDKLTQHMINKGYKIEPLPGLELIDDDISNAKDFLGKTAYYDPYKKHIVLYTHGRHPKDIARSYAHEMIHHIQNLEGRLGPITTTNTQEDDHLNDIEAEANLKGTMTFRNWTDSLNEAKKGANNSMVAVLSKNGHQISLYDFDNKEPLGLINTYGNEVTGVAAKKGYGPLMYELGMANVYPNGLQSDRNGNTEPEAEAVLNKFIEGASPNIKAVKLTPKDKEYRTEYPNGNELWDVDGFYNYKFYNADASTLKQLLQKGNELYPNEQSDIISSTEEMYDSMVNEGTDSLNEVGDATQQPYKWTKTVSKDPDDGLIEGVDYRFTTDLDTNYVAFFQMVLPMQYEFGFNIPGGNQAQVSNKGELFRVMATMVAIMKDFMDLMGNDWSEISFSGSKDPSRSEDNRRDKLYMAYIKKNLPSTVSVGVDYDDMTVLTNTLAEGFNKKLGKDPFGLNAYAYELARGLEEALTIGDKEVERIDKPTNNPEDATVIYKDGTTEPYLDTLNEGAYDSLTTKLTKATINKWVEDSKKKPMPKKSFVDIDIDEFDGKGREIEFNYVGIVEFDKKVDGYEVDGTSNSGEDEGKMPFVATMFRINPKILPQSWSKISADVSDVIRHEIEHLTQSGDNVRGQVYDDEGNLIDKGKYMDDDIQIRDMINKLKILPKSDYYKLEKEVDAMLQGLYLKAKKSKKPFADVVDQFLDIAPGIDTKEDKEDILNLWRSRRKALSLPVFETRYKLGKVMNEQETEQKYKIYCDMDGVLTDFDTQFKKISGGIAPKDYEDKNGQDAFWDIISKEGVGYWVGMPWMPNGKKLWEYIAKYNPTLLSAPSMENESRLGKRLWVRNNIKPKPKLILASAANKPNYSGTNRILIDDRPDTIEKWRAKGGIGILFISTAQTIKELQELGL